MSHTRVLSLENGRQPGASELTVRTDPGTLVATLFGLPATAPIPLPFGDAWLALGPTAPLVVGIGVADAAGVWRSTVSVWPGYPQGEALVYQSVAFDQGTITLSNPVADVVR